MTIDINAVIGFYRENEYGIVPIDRDKKFPTANGWNKQTKCIDDLAEQVIAGHINIGCLHSKSKTAAFDIDDLQRTQSIFQQLGIDLDSIIAKGTRVENGSQNRGKVWFRVPDTIKPGDLGRRGYQYTDDSGKKHVVFELRSGNCQDVLPPSMHPKTQQEYKWIDDPRMMGVIPPVLLNMWLNWDEAKETIDSLFNNTEQGKKQQKSQIKDKPVKKAGDHSVIQTFNDAHDLEIMFERYGYKKKGKRFLSPSSSSGLPGIHVFEDEHFYSHHVSCVFADGKRHDAFDIFCIYEHQGNVTNAVIAAASMLGMSETNQIEDPNLDIDYLNICSKKDKHAVNSDSVRVAKEVPTQLYNPPGILKDAFNHVMSESRYPQPIFAINAALSLVATCCARQFQLEEVGARTSLFFVNLGKTGSGKDYPRSFIKEMLSENGRGDLVCGEDLASGQGLMLRAHLTPNGFFNLDEIGDFVAACTDPKSASYKKAILVGFTKLWSSTNTTLTGSEKADQEDNERKDIQHPCVNLFSAGNPSAFYDALKGQNIASGFLNRFIICETQEDRPNLNKRRARRNRKPKYFTDWIAQLDFQVNRGSNLGAVLSTDPKFNDGSNAIEVPISDEALNLLDDITEEIDDKLRDKTFVGEKRDLYVRAAELISRVALVCGCADGFQVTEQHVKWARDYVIYWTDNLILQVELNLAENDFDKVRRSVLKTIISFGAEGGTKRELAHKCRPFKSALPRTRSDVITSLIDDGEINSFPTKSQGNGKVVYKMIANDYIERGC